MIESKDPMKSTWRLGDRRLWRYYHWIIEKLGLQHVNLNQEVPVHQKGDPVPYVPHWQFHRWILVHACVPLILHQTFVSYTGFRLHPVAAFVFYSAAIKFIAIHQINIMRDLGHLHGFLDGDKHERDGVPDTSVKKVLHSLISTATFRSMLAVMLAYRSSEAPSSINWMLAPLEVGLYGVVLDFWFYWYHRLMHEVDFLWKYHRTHHLTKHPNPLLTLFADTEQEIWDIAGIPILTYATLKLFGFPMGFYEWWLCQQYVIFTELSGHSGLRIYATTPTPFAWPLRLFNCDLVLEDHDLHHRKGWKKSGNYGKHTRLWDRIFGTCMERLECPDDKIDYVNTVVYPLIRG
ncbi:fatty acid hydroxylase superfamily protein [Colletotrichum karsti]|uniref:Fatty acid hydroxylase superfamily protein n=1 Tax=Colletotrichum karsti TaxID=1095194 RepID=A0A9P6I786_9PEZI|nr:fatty acid hydroxylase superfamily protein [Colletotrichum karsti]KAF9877269.1 fatty acid hydroxylase superfamily protein [Colletotrichum karsti]